MASVYWNYKEKAEIDIGNYADDLIRWPIYLSRELQADAMGNDSEIIETEDFDSEEEEEK